MASASGASISKIVPLSGITGIRKDLIEKKITEGGYAVDQIIGYGFRSIVYSVKDRENRTLALKYYDNVEELKQEAFILLEIEKKPHFPRYMEHAIFGNNTGYLVMTQTGPNFQTLLEKCRPISLNTTLHVGLQLFDIICSLHACGYAHNDIELPNVTVSSRSREIFLIDFGMATRCLTSSELNSGKENQHSSSTLMKQTSSEKDKRKSSLFFDNSRIPNDFLGRKQDLYGLLNFVVHLQSEESSSGSQDTKSTAKKSLRNRIVTVGTELLEFEQHLSKLKTTEHPNYIYLRKCFERLIESRHFPLQNYEWQDKMFDLNEMMACKENN